MCIHIGAIDIDMDQVTRAIMSQKIS